MAVVPEGTRLVSHVTLRFAYASALGYHAGRPVRSSESDAIQYHGIAPRSTAVAERFDFVAGYNNRCATPPAYL